MFDLNRRAVGAVPEGASFPNELTEDGQARLSLTYQQRHYGLRLAGRGTPPVAFELPAQSPPTCYSLLRHLPNRRSYQIVVGDRHGGLLGFDPARRSAQQRFSSHSSFITSLSESAAGGLLTSSSTDGTICLWSLADRPKTAWFGFLLDGDFVRSVPDGSSAQQAGIRAGDQLVTLDGQSLAAVQVQRRAGRFPYRIGQHIVLGLDRAGVPYQTEVELVAAQEVVEPMLTLVMTNRHEWIMWTPEGYFDASPGAGDLLGFHINQGPERSAQFVPVHQFRQQLYRPDILDQVLRVANVPEAITAANDALPTPTAAVDLRHSETIARMRPPAVRILSPGPGESTNEREIHVLAEALSQDGNPITDAWLLVNGRPYGDKGALIVTENGPVSRVSISRIANLLPGENSISVIARNTHATSLPATVTVTYEAPQAERARRPNLHLLSIGVSRYANERLNLRYAHLDATDFAAAWETQRGRLYDEVATTLLVNEDASCTPIREALSQLLKSVERRDVAVIFISAHGVRDTRLEYYLGTHEVDPQNLPATGLYFREVTRVLEQLPCKVLLFVDTCHSAGITGAKAIAADPLYELTSDEYGTIVFASSLSREISLEDEAWGHGAFTAALLETFSDTQSDLNGDGYLSLTELEQRVYDRVQALTEGTQHPVMSRPATVPNLRFFQFGQPNRLAVQ